MTIDNTKTFRRRVTLAALLVVIVATAWFFYTYGSWRVIAGMDTMLPEITPGSTCVIQKNPGSVKKDSVVVLSLPGGAVLLSRVARVEDDRIFIRHDNRESSFLAYEKQAYPMSEVRGLVLTVLVPDPVPPTGPAEGSQTPPEQPRAK